MKINKTHYLVGMIGNIIVLTVSLIGILMFVFSGEFSVQAFQFFTVISNILVAFAALLIIPFYLVSYLKNKNYLNSVVQTIKLITVVMITITFLMVIIFLAPATPDYGWFDRYQLFLHMLTPIVTMVSFIFLEYAFKLKFRYTFIPAIVVLAYGTFYIIYSLNAPIGTDVDWYGFLFKPGERIAPVHGEVTWLNLIIFAAESLGGAVVFGILFWLLNKIMNLIFIGYTIEETNEAPNEVVKEQEITEESEVNQPINESSSDEVVEEVKEEKPTQTKKNNKTNNGTAKYKDGARVYHIARSKFVSKHWQVKLAGGERAIKIFDTQAEAIAFAKELVKTQGGSIRIHSMKGQIRK